MKRLIALSVLVLSSAVFAQSTPASIPPPSGFPTSFNIGYNGNVQPMNWSGEGYAYLATINNGLLQGDYDRKLNLIDITGTLPNGDGTWWGNIGTYAPNYGFVASSDAQLYGVTSVLLPEPSILGLGLVSLYVLGRRSR